MSEVALKTKIRSKLTEQLHEIFRDRVNGVDDEKALEAFLEDINDQRIWIELGEWG